MTGGEKAAELVAIGRTVAGRVQVVVIAASAVRTRQPQIGTRWVLDLIEDRPRRLVRRRSAPWPPWPTFFGQIGIYRLGGDGRVPRATLVVGTPRSSRVVEDVRVVVG